MFTSVAHGSLHGLGIYEGLREPNQQNIVFEKIDVEVLLVDQKQWSV